jgi:hypothetical protein
MKVGDGGIFPFPLMKMEENNKYKDKWLIFIVQDKVPNSPLTYILERETRDDETHQD